MRVKYKSKVYGRGCNGRVSWQDRGAGKGVRRRGRQINKKQGMEATVFRAGYSGRVDGRVSKQGSGAGKER